MDDFVDSLTQGRPIGDEEVAAAARSICARSQQWDQNIELTLGSKRWIPNAVSKNKEQLLYVFLTDELPRFVRDRIMLAANCKIRPVVALHIASLFKPDVIALLVEVDAEVIVLDDYVPARRFQSRSVLSALADIEVQISAELRQAMEDAVWSQIRNGDAHEKGQRLETLLAFVFAQASGLKVIERNFRNETEEIDLVLQIDNASGRIWQQLGAPFILVEAKNRADKASQQTVSSLITKLQTKRGSARIAVLVSLAGFTEDARQQELRFSTQNVCIVMLERVHLQDMLVAENVGDKFEEYVRKALLR